MKIIRKRFRCDLCGQYASVGVSETRAQDGLDTHTCWRCIQKAIVLLLDRSWDVK